MAKGGKKKGKTTKKSAGIKRNPLFESRPRNYRIGNSIQHQRDLTRFVRWPRYILLQRQKRILLQRLKVPPAISQISHTVDSNQAKSLFRLLSKYQPETKQKKRERLLAEAQNKAAGQEKTKSGPKPVALKYGLNHITNLIENKKARLVVIAHDVDPVELILWLPALCRRQDVPFAIVKGKSRLGKLVHLKTAAAVALTEVRKEDVAELETLAKNFRAQFNENATVRREWGGGLLGLKSQHREDAKKKAHEQETLKKA
eukprot:TRINITY_DN6009_c0_g1_i2.p1 TRINITY_DN6009_c0_g1~~TRINITY_DN6009_c0_g1_i2.p1  ORF type:complete len:258 (-),score=100.88 TRINITY_DN6009_c0_g1_i2:635-1408(-)